MFGKKIQIQNREISSLELRMHDLHIEVSHLQQALNEIGIVEINNKFMPFVSISVPGEAAGLLNKLLRWDKDFSLLREKVGELSKNFGESQTSKIDGLIDYLGLELASEPAKTVFKKKSKKE